ncbi:MAG: DUF2270 domain-containing protein [Chloroflexota bacterium]|nr:MAG: DUF2270 domain-containing protein [Chloroflexota bacterium]
MADPEPVWTYRGYQLRPGDFATAMVHFFRSEIARANIWRQRLDTTTNWAVVSTGASISFAFSDPSALPFVIVLNTLLVTMFLAIEARRYRYYELWSLRVRLMETDFFAAMLVPPFKPDPDWAESLAESLLQPHFPVSMFEAVGRRLRRNYIWIYLVLGLSFFMKIALQPEPATTWSELISRATLGPIPGELVILMGVMFNLILLMVGLLTMGLHEATGEVLPRFAAQIETGLGDHPLKRWQVWFRPSYQRQQLIALIITDQEKVVSERILGDLKRGVTAMPGTGMYTGKTHGVLMVALTVTEVNKLRSMVAEEDVNAFVVVLPARSVYGKGFSPLDGRAP